MVRTLGSGEGGVCSGLVSAGVGGARRSSTGQIVVDNAMVKWFPCAVPASVELFNMVEVDFTPGFVMPFLFRFTLNLVHRIFFARQIMTSLSM